MCTPVLAPRPESLALRTAASSGRSLTFVAGATPRPHIVLTPPLMPAYWILTRTSWGPGWRSGLDTTRWTARKLAPVREPTSAL